MPHQKVAPSTRRSPRVADQPQRPQRAVFELWDTPTYRPESMAERVTGRASIGLAMLMVIYICARIAGWPA